MIRVKKGSNKQAGHRKFVCPAFFLWILARAVLISKQSDRRACVEGACYRKDTLKVQK
ncbi:hypothetical protein EVA_19420 [gut metagenome]|uniref:Uncharacterized protein n=1 Tax=gut metagenome TaxID=749906 RepID=J9FDI9_9ZZZZ